MFFNSAPVNGEKNKEIPLSENCERRKLDDYIFFNLLSGISSPANG